MSASGCRRRGWRRLVARAAANTPDTAGVVTAAGAVPCPPATRANHLARRRPDFRGAGGGAGIDTGRGCTSR